MKRNFLIALVFIIAVNISALYEDFETGDLSSYAWDVGGNASFYITSYQVFEGIYAVVGGNINDSQSTFISLDYDFEESGILKFYWKVSSELNYDFLKFYLDN